MNKKELNKFAEPIVNLYTSLENDMLENIAKRLSGKTTLLETDPEAWKLQMIENLGMLDKDNIKLIRDKAGLTSYQLNSILVNAGLSSIEADEKVIEKAIKKGAHLLKPDPISESPTILNILKSYSDQAINVLNLTNQSLIKETNKAYLDILSRTVLDTMSGHLTGEQALRKTIRQWSEKGIPVLRDRAGRERGVEGYIRTVMVSTTNNVVNEMQDTRLNEYGIELVEVTSHSGARPKCAPYQGRIFSLKKDHPKYPYIGGTSMGEPDGLFGINCGHYKYPFIEGISEQRYKPYDKKENAENYKESQKQREIERSIRKAKTQKRMFEALGDKEGLKKANRLINGRQKAMRKFIDDTGRTRRRYSEQLVGGSKAIPKVPVELGTKMKPKQASEILKPQTLKDLVKKQEKKKKLEVKEKKQIKSGYSKFEFEKYKLMDKMGEDVKRHAKIIKDMKPNERRAITHYTGSAYDQMNEYLRNGAWADDKYVTGAVNDLINVFDKYKTELTEDTLFYRRVNHNMMDFWFDDKVGKMVREVWGGTKNKSEVIDDLKKRIVDTQLYDKAFGSASYADNVFTKPRGVEIQIHAPKGYDGGMIVNSVSKYKDQEYEYLLREGRKFKVIDVDVEMRDWKDRRNGKYLVLKVVPDDK